MLDFALFDVCCGVETSIEMLCERVILSATRVDRSNRTKVRTSRFPLYLIATSWNRSASIGFKLRLEAAGPPARFDCARFFVRAREKASLR
jgi:hypothetical protein